MGNRVTVEELQWHLDRLDRDLRDRWHETDNRIDRMAGSLVTTAVLDERLAGLQARVGELEGSDTESRSFRRNVIVVLVGSLAASIGAVVATVLAAIIH